MPIEIIGEFGTSGAEREWITAQGKRAIRHLKKLCGEPPANMRLVIEWQEHELGYYPIIALVWEDGMVGIPENYLARCQVALEAYENGGELPPGWTMPPVCPEDDDLDEPFDPDKPPPDPPNAFDVFEYQHYISKLIQWGFEACKKERSRPHLVASDDEQE